VVVAAAGTWFVGDDTLSNGLAAGWWRTRAGPVGPISEEHEEELAGILYVNLEERTSCTACYQPDICPVDVFAD
jgi:hypothetical protein